jgi:16S rRNA processing protein RimM
MIRREDLVKIGEFKKTHGIRGEIAFAFTSEVFDRNDRSFLFCELDGIFVPFVLEEFRFTAASTALVKLKTVDSESKARLLSNRNVYFSKDHFPVDVENASFTWNYFIGFTLHDRQTGKIGHISDVNESTINILFVVEKEGEEIFVPATDEWIVAIDEEKKILHMELPEGLF